jgi:cell division protein FtsI (penicillin-binding protein 3)
VQSLELPGIVVSDDTQRAYPGGDLGAGVLGFINAEGVGSGGMEMALNSVLSGHDGKQVVETDNEGRQIPGGEDKISPAVPGRNVELTLDRDIQWSAQSALAAQVKATHSDSGTALVMDPRTGEILALATVPTFDPNDLAHANSNLLGNPAASDAYEPGSVNKVITAAAALETGVVTPETPIDVPGELKVADRVFHDAEQHGTERLTFAGVLARSSNIGTIETAKKLGKGVLYDYLRKFGFGSTTGSGFPAESAGIVRDPSTWTESDNASIPIGQGIAVTPLQIASVYATVANGGIRVTPHIVKATYDANGKAHPNTKITTTRIIQADTAKTIREMLESVTTVDGTAPAAAIDGYRIAGKTGTARKINATGTDYSGYISTFVGMAPADNPRLIVEVILDNPKTAIFGGVVAAPVFHDVMSFALESLRIPPSGRPSAVFRLTAP